MQVYDTSNRRRENVQMFLKMAQTHDKNSITGISGFVRYINSIYDNNQDVDKAKSNATLDSVTIKTIHGSKGLEFPFVFLCDVGRRFNETDTTETIQKSFQHGLSYKLKDVETFVEYSTVDTLYISNAKRSELRSEKMRLFYVALTRAKEKLFIPLTLSAVNPKDDSKLTTDYKNVAKYIDTIEHNECIPSRLVKGSIHMVDWLLMVLCCCNKAQPLRTFFDLNTDFLFKTDANLDVYLYDPDQFNLTDDNATIEENFTVDETVKESIMDRCNYVYGNIHANLPARLSVSDIVKDDKAKIEVSSGYVSNIRFDGLKTPTFMTSLRMTPAERGTAIHTAMQYCDFSKLESNVTAEINRLKDEGYLSKEQFDVMDFKVFDKFVVSDIFKLAMSSKKIERERDFLVKVSELGLDNDVLDVYKSTETMLQGCIDLLIFEDDGVILVDYKSDNITEKNIEVLKDRYSLQLELYKYAIELVENVKVKRKVIYSMKLGKSIDL
jgi:ATP-dependent helicase/nuclease subunit A